jgi:single-strand selective monofunctional uracil DNA glycosylase
MDIRKHIRKWIEDLKRLEFAKPVCHIYNPLEYACRSYEAYLRRYASPPKEVVFLGMNPGPWGMAQTGIPFGEITLVKEWLKIEAPVLCPKDLHPKRPVLGFDCRRSEVSGKRLWGWARSTFKTPDRFFSRFFVVNYCPLMFFDENGRNITPDRLRASEQKPLWEACDRAIRQIIDFQSPRYLVGVGRFAEARARTLSDGKQIIVGRITHPSPANPLANRGWDHLIEEELSALGIRIRR